MKSGKKSDKPFFFLSFDDGLRECYEVVYPILKEKRIQAAFFINPGFVDNIDLFYRFKVGLILEKIHKSQKNRVKEVGHFLESSFETVERLADKIKRLKYSDLEKIDQIAELLGIDFKEVLKTEKPYMSLSQINELSQNGYLIGSHSQSHPVFSHLEMREQINQLEQSMLYIERNFDSEILTFAFPFSDLGVSSSFFEYIENSSDVEITFGTSGLKKDLSSGHVHRIPMDTKNYKNAEQIIRGEYAYFILKSIAGKNTLKR